MILPLAYYGNPILRKKCKRVEAIDDDLRKLVADLEETMFAHDGIGLAAPQVGIDLTLFVRNIPTQTSHDQWVPGKTEVFINPKILEYSQEKDWRGEGCLSIPNLYGEVERPSRIKVEYTNMEGNRVTAEYSGLKARNIMHENDHLNGVLFIDRIYGKERQEMEQTLREIKKKYAGK